MKGVGWVGVLLEGKRVKGVNGVKRIERKKGLGIWRVRL